MCEGMYKQEIKTKQKNMNHVSMKLNIDFEEWSLALTTFNRYVLCIPYIDKNIYIE